MRRVSGRAVRRLEAGGSTSELRGGRYMTVHPLCTVLHFRKGNNLLHLPICNTLQRGSWKTTLAVELPLRFCITSPRFPVWRPAQPAPTLPVGREGRLSFRSGQRCE